MSRCCCKCCLERVWPPFSSPFLKCCKSLSGCHDDSFPETFPTGRVEHTLVDWSVSELCFRSYLQVASFVYKNNAINIRCPNHFFPWACRSLASSHLIRQRPPLTLSGSSPFKRIACLIPYLEGS